MAHPQQEDFIRRTLARFSEFTNVDVALEIGSQDINGSLRSFIQARSYIGIDLAIGQAVDFRCDGEHLEIPDSWCDVVASTECLEHAHNWEGIVKNAIRICKAKGLILLTFAGLYRPAHGVLDSKDIESSPWTSNYYSNIDKDTFMGAITLGEYFTSYGFEACIDPGDSYFWGIRSEATFAHSSKAPTKILVDRLSRAQGQLGQALSRLANANRTISEYEQENKRLYSKLNLLQDQGTHHEA